MVLAGPPGSSKTSLAAWWAGRWAEAGVPVLFVAADEPADSVVTRLGQSRLNLDREALERGDEAAREALATWLDAHPIEVVDLDEADLSFDAAVEAWEVMLEKLGASTGVVVADSIQALARRVAHWDGDLDAAQRPTTERARVDRVVSDLRRVASGGHAVLGLSEVARGLYRSRSPDERIDPLAAAKESGGIEFMADVLAVLRSVEGAHDLIDVVIAKNRTGRRGDFRIRRDADRCSYEDLGSGAMNPLDEQAAEARIEQRRDALRRRVIAAIEKHRGLTSKSALAAWVTGRRAEVLGTIDQLLADGSIEKRDGAFAVRGEDQA